MMIFERAPFVAEHPPPLAHRARPAEILFQIAAFSNSPRGEFASGEVTLSQLAFGPLAPRRAARCQRDEDRRPPIQ